ncbi:MAG: hypothetical protein QXW91_05640, partial [Candidatus Nitrosotenuis sp.]
MKSFESGSFERDLEKIRHLTGIVKKRLLESNPNYERKIANLTEEELEDLDVVLGLAERLLIKYYHKKDAYYILKEFVDMMKDWSGPLDGINDELQVLLMSAQYSITEIKTAQSDVSSNLSFDKHSTQKQSGECVGTINLTKSATPVYTQEY